MYRKVAAVTIVVLLLSLAFASVSFAQSGTTSSSNSQQNQSQNSNGNQANNNGQGFGPDNPYRALGPGGVRNLRANEQQWYAFEYAGDNSPIQIRLTGSNTQFSVWTQQQINAAGGNFGASANPAGRSTSNSQFGGDQFWQGSFNTPGTYYVLVENASGGQGGSYTLSVTGTGVSWKGQSANNTSSANNNSSSKSTSSSSNNTSKSGSTASTTPKTLPRTGGEMASVLPMLIGGMGALSVTAGALLRRKK
jgi:LPXTG-motif cell wall-anchored protein